MDEIKIVSKEGIDKRIKLPDGEVVDLMTFLAWIGNKLLKIEESLK